MSDEIKTDSGQNIYYLLLILLIFIFKCMVIHIALHYINICIYGKHPRYGPKQMWEDCVEDDLEGSERQ